MTVLRASVKMGVSVLLTMRKGCWSVIGKKKVGGTRKFLTLLPFPFFGGLCVSKEQCQKVGEKF